MDDETTHLEAVEEAIALRDLTLDELANPSHQLTVGGAGSRVHVMNDGLISRLSNKCDPSSKVAGSAARAGPEVILRLGGTGLDGQHAGSILVLLVCV
jgi:hypothetical protein